MILQREGTQVNKIHHPSGFIFLILREKKNEETQRDVLFKWNMEQSMFSLPEPQREKKGDCGHASYQYFHAT